MIPRRVRDAVLDDVCGWCGAVAGGHPHLRTVAGGGKWSTTTAEPSHTCRSCDLPAWRREWGADLVGDAREEGARALLLLDLRPLLLGAAARQTLRAAVTALDVQTTCLDAWCAPGAWRALGVYPDAHQECARRIASHGALVAQRLRLVRALVSPQRGHLAGATRVPELPDDLVAELGSPIVVDA